MRARLEKLEKRVDKILCIIRDLETGGGGGIASIQEGNGITVDNTDSDNPIVNLALEGYSETGTRADNNLFVRIGDDGAAETRITIDRANNFIAFGRYDSTGSNEGIKIFPASRTISAVRVGTGGSKNIGGTSTISFGQTGDFQTFTNLGVNSIAVGTALSLTGASQNSAVFGSGNSSVQSDTFIAGANNTVNGTKGAAIGIGLSSKSFSEIVLGTFNTDYTATSATVFNSSDRLFVIGNGASSGTRSNALTILKNGRAAFGATIRTAGYTFATLPATPTTGDRAYITDANAPTYGANASGGGAVTVPVFYNGSNWIYV